MNYRNAKFVNTAIIDCEIEHPVYGWIPFTCDPNDTGALFNTATLFNQMANNPETIPYVEPTPEELLAIKSEEVRAKRNNLLATVVDPIVMNSLRWGALTDNKKKEVSDYREALLDITSQETFPTSVIWPDQPTV
jgi:hypothetical protein